MRRRLPGGQYQNHRRTSGLAQPVRNVLRVLSVVSRSAVPPPCRQSSGHAERSGLRTGHFFGITKKPVVFDKVYALVLQNVTASIWQMRTRVTLPKQEVRPGHPGLQRVISLQRSHVTPTSSPVKQQPSQYIVTTLSMLLMSSSTIPQHPECKALLTCMFISPFSESSIIYFIRGGGIWLQCRSYVTVVYRRCLKTLSFVVQYGV